LTLEIIPFPCLLSEVTLSHKASLKNLDDLDDLASRGRPVGLGGDALDVDYTYEEFEEHEQQHNDGAARNGPTGADVACAHEIIKVRCLGSRIMGLYIHTNYTIELNSECS